MSDRIEELLEQEGFVVFKQKNNKIIKKNDISWLTYRIN